MEMERERETEGARSGRGRGGAVAWLRGRSQGGGGCGARRWGGTRVSERDRERKEMGRAGQNLTWPIALARLARQLCSA